MNEQLIVKNFGPIKDATVDFKKVTVFIGPTGGGKSTLAKLAAIFRDVDFYASSSSPLYLFEHYNIKNFLTSKSELSLQRGEQGVKVRGNRITYNPQTRKLIKQQAKEATQLLTQDNTKRSKILNRRVNQANKLSSSNEEISKQINEDIEILFDNLIEETSSEILKLILTKLFHYTYPAYIPSERIFLSSINNSWAGLMRDDIGLPPTLLDFANNYAQARSLIKELSISLFDIVYVYNGEEDRIAIKGSNKLIELHEAASGIQSTTPLMILLEHLSRTSKYIQSFIIEEPELNLFPSTQKGLIDWIIEKCTSKENDLIITTHSPYILASCNLLMEAYKVWQQRPELESEINKIVPRASWINPDDFAAYYVDKEVRSIKDERTDLIGGNDLDAVSGSISDAFRNLLRLKKQPA